MKKLAFVLALLALPAVVFAGNATLSLKQNTTNATALTFGPAGGTLTVNVWLSTTAADAPEGISNIAATLRGTKKVGGASVNSVFTVVTRSAWTAGGTTTYGPFNNADFWDNTMSGTAIGGVMAPDSKSLGVAATSGLGTGPKGNYTVPTAAWTNEDDPENPINYSYSIPWRLMRLTVTLAANPNGGDYMLGFAPGSIVGTTTGAGVYPADMTTSLVGMNIVQTPEPMTMLLLAAALPFLRRRSA